MAKTSLCDSLLIQAGGCFGLSAAACRTGFLLAQGSGSNLWIPVGIAFSALLTSSGFVIQTRGLKDGNTVVVCTCAAVSSMVSGTGTNLCSQLYIRIWNLSCLGDHVKMSWEPVHCLSINYALTATKYDLMIKWHQLSVGNHYGCCHCMHMQYASMYWFTQ